MSPDGNADPQRGLAQFIVGTGGTHVVAAAASKPATPAAQQNPDQADNVGFGILQLTLHPDGYDYEFIGVSGTTFSDHDSGTCH